MTTDLVYRLRKRAEIRRQIPGRKSVENGEPDRIADLLDEAAERIAELEKEIRVSYAWNTALAKQSKSAVDNKVNLEG